MAKKYYAVKNGKDGVSGVYLTWEDCKSQAQGVPGAEYKGFSTVEEAEAFLRGEDGAGESAPKKSRRKEPPPEPPYPEKEGGAVAYTDGSYNAATGEFSCGAVLFFAGERVDFSQKCADPDMAEMRNVAGEIMAATLAIRWCLEHDVPALDIYHDYNGVAGWATGRWKTNRPGTRAYAAFCQKAARRLELRFVQVQGHSGDYWNDQADRLAKQALGLM